MIGPRFSYGAVPCALFLSLSLVVGACGSRSAEPAPGTLSATDPASQAAAVNPLVTCFRGENAYAHIANIVAFGTRHLGTPGIDQTRQYIEKTLRQAQLVPKQHPFTAHTPHPEIGATPCLNISVDIPGTDADASGADDSDKIVIFSGHFDGKIIDEGIFWGANDGGSSTGVLLEMARCLQRHPPKRPVRLVFFDAEESLLDWTDADSLYGSKNYAAELISTGDKNRVAALVNIDMVGDPRLRFEDEQHSTAWVMQALRDAATALGRPELFAGGRRVHIEDDHLPFVRIGIPAANLIDLNYGPGWDSNAWWHTANDNLQNISKESLEISGRIALQALPSLYKEPQ
ncbi:MAG: M28 family metallopeptidase [Proteobacteria bacterium]|nr:M28 family metallopeptidase [Pseudomonadota bacterium]